MRKLLVGLVALIALPSCATVHQAGIIDWVDFVKWNGVMYIALPAANNHLPETALGAQVGTVKKKVADVVTDPAYATQDGDAAFLPIATAIYSLKDYRTSFRLAVKTSGVVIYEADSNPRARTGSDLLDLAGKVSSIEVAAPSGSGGGGVITDPAVVGPLVDLVLNSPVNQSFQPPDAPAYTITFDLADGTRSRHAFWPAAALLGRGIIVPQEFVDIVTKPLR